MMDLQASIAALPRLHPGLLVARAQAADLAGRLQAHAQVCLVLQQLLFCSNLPSIAFRTIIDFVIGLMQLSVFLLIFIQIVTILCELDH